MRTIGVVTTARSDYGIYLPVLRAIQAEPELRLALIVAGMHLAPEFGRSVRLIEEAGFPIAERVEMLLASDSPEGIAKSMGLGLLGYAPVLARLRPDILLVLGDRFEMHAAALAALPFNIPVAHIHGGELTQGAIDDALRHSMTKLSHLHFVATDEYARRVVQMGEEPWRVVVCGAPGLDNLRDVALLERGEFSTRYGVPLDEPPLLVTFHPVTLEFAHTAWHVEELLAALHDTRHPLIFTLPNADTASSNIRQRIHDFVASGTRAWVLDNLGTTGYFSLMRLAAAMVGNSSSGLIEAPSFALPVVNIGTRQQGRIRGANVIDVNYHRQDIAAGIERALSPAFRESLHGRPNPYGDGAAAPRIVRTLRDVPLEDRLSRKVFFDIRVPAADLAHNAAA